MTEPSSDIDWAFSAPPGQRGGAPDPAFAGAVSFMRRRYTKNIAGADSIIWGVPFDWAASNRPGTRFGPRGIRTASVTFDCEPQFPTNRDPFEDQEVIDFGDMYIDFGRPADSYAKITTEARQLLAPHRRLISLGGDHSITLPLLRAHCQKFGPLALVHFDAHPDSWGTNDRLSHGNFVRYAVEEGLILPENSIQVGIRTFGPEDLGIKRVYAEALYEMSAENFARLVSEIVGSRSTYLTFDIDCLDPAFAPGTGTPVAGGISTLKALSLLWAIRALNWVGMDVVEVSPPFDHAEITSLAAATVVQHFLQFPR